MTDAAPIAMTGDLLRGRFNLLLAGAGHMGGSLLEAWLDGGIDVRRFTVIDPHLEATRADALRRRGIALNGRADATQPADVLMLAIKPQMLGTAAPELLAYAGPNTLVVSVVAGKTMADLRKAFPGVGAIARAMPNTPAAIRRGITGVAAEPQVTEAQRATVQALLEAVGSVEWLADEGLIDAVTAVSGSGPAYVFYLAECLAKAGEAAGLEAGVAMRLARATVEGAGALMTARVGDAPSLLRQNVTSPGGTTAAALDVLMRDGALAGLMNRAVSAAKRRAGELAG